MSTLNTLFNAATARNTAVTARTVNKIADAGRRWELQQRGWITPAATPTDVAAVEAVLAAQMRARVEMQSGRPWPFGRVAITGGLAGALLLLATVGLALDRNAKPGAVLVVFSFLLLVAAFAGVAVLVVRRHEDLRREVLARAVVRDGHCQWCGSPAPHLLEGESTEPRVFHAVEIERQIDEQPR